MSFLVGLSAQALDIRIIGRLQISERFPAKNAFDPCSTYDDQPATRYATSRYPGSR